MPARGSRLVQLMPPSFDAAEPEMVSKRRPPSTVTRGASAKRSLTNRFSARSDHFDGSLGSVKSQTRAGRPLRSSPTRPLNTDCWLAPPPYMSAPARMLCPPIDRLRRAPNDQVLSVPIPGSSSVGIGPSRRRSTTITDGATRSLDRWASV